MAQYPIYFYILNRLDLDFRVCPNQWEGGVATCNIGVIKWNVHRLTVRSRI
jgi:hypothetical protein